MKCPNCNETLVMSDRNGIEIDYCPNCRGVWLDRGELDKIIERSTPYNTGKPSDIHGASDHREREHYSKDDDYRYKKRKKESFLGDLFDF